MARELKGLGAMGLEIMGAPDIVHRGLAEALSLRQGPATPMRHPRWFGLQGCVHDGGNLIDGIQGLSSSARSNVPQTVQSFVPKALAPQNHRIAVHRKLLGNGDIGFTCGGGQDDTAAPSYLLWRAVRSDPLLNFLLFYGGNPTILAHAPASTRPVTISSSFLYTPLANS